MAVGDVITIFLAGIAGGIAIMIGWQINTGTFPLADDLEDDEEEEA